MYCSGCGSPIVPGSLFCSACGNPVSVVAPPPVLAALKRPPMVTVLAVLQFLGAGFGLLVAIVTLFIGLTADGGSALLLAALVMAVVGTAELLCGVGLIKMRPYGRTMQMAFAWIGLIGIPFGTIISILILIYMFKPGIKALFSGRPPSDFSSEERAQIEEVSGGSTVALALMAVVAVLVLVAVIGIVAAIAIPGLMRARMAGNEASAIGSLRAINSAQSTFASVCAQGAYAVALAELAIPPRGSRAEGFISPDLAADPVLKSGYSIRLVAGDPNPNAAPACNGARVAGDYFVSAEPATPGVTGMRFFATNSEGTIFTSASPIPVTFRGVPAGSTPLQ
jgi:type IV pilus assembly protein PilA